MLICYHFGCNVPVINNGNCTEWSAIWSEIKRVITKSICNHKFDFRPKLHDTKCNFHFITFILKSTSGNVSLFTKYAPELAASCNIATREQNGRDIKSDDPKQWDLIADFHIKLMETKRKTASKIS